MSIISILRARAQLTPGQEAFAFIDYDARTGDDIIRMTWHDLYCRSTAISRYLANHHGHAQAQKIAAISAPQGLDYVVGFLGALSAGWTAVPLPEPRGSLHDKRTGLALIDCSADVMLTTSQVEDQIRSAMASHGLGVTTPVIALDAVHDLCDPPGTERESDDCQRAECGSYLQYTSGSTANPRGAIISPDNVLANLQHVEQSYFIDDKGNVKQPGSVVSWLPLYHDMGLMVGIFMPIFFRCPAILMSPASFIRKPARWMQLLAKHPAPFTAAPNFAFDLASSRISEQDMRGLDLGHVSTIINGAERVQPQTIEEFLNRFARYNLSPAAVRPSYGMAEAVVYVATTKTGSSPVVTEFDSQTLACGHAELATPETDRTTRLVRYHHSGREPLIRIVDPDSNTELGPGRIGEIWIHGKNVSDGYYNADAALNRGKFQASIRETIAGMPKLPWLRTGDLGFVLGADFYIIGRIKDLIIQDGVNHYPEDIESSVQDITGGRVAAFASSDECGERLVIVAEMRRADTADNASELGCAAIKKQVVAAVSRLHGLRVADFLLVPQGALPRTTSGKISRAACAHWYQAGRFVLAQVPQ